MKTESSERRVGLGIDTGGTYTDAVIVDLNMKKVLAKAKARTTHHNLALGIVQSLDNVLEVSDFPPEQIQLVGVSTTLATNSILEGKGGKVGLIGIGWKPESGWRMGAEKEVFISGGHDSQGEEKAPLLMDEVREAAHAMEGVDAVAVSGIFSVYNRSHEEMVREAIKEILHVPVVCGHELTGELGIKERTVTAVLNARLIPLINMFLDDVESSLRKRGIIAPIMVFKGDGTLMSLWNARERPVETILSGPAASAMGGKTLAGVDTCIIIDMGGTSTDIAFLDDGFPRISIEGASVGPWRTRVRAVDMWTAAVGGDSEILVGSGGEISVSPNRVLPLSLTANRYPGFRDKIKESRKLHYLVAQNRKNASVSAREKAILEFLEKTGPSTIEEIRHGTGLILIDRYLNSLTTNGLIVGIGLTPTDLLHVRGDYIEGDVAAATLGVEIASGLANLSRDEFVERAINTVSSRIAEEIIKKIMMDEAGVIPSCTACSYLLDTSTGKRDSDLLKMSVRIERPVVGLGAPAHIWIPMLEDKLGTKVIVPEDHEVGNAVGAVCSQVAETVEVHVIYRDLQFRVITPFCEPLVYDNPSDAIKTAIKMATEYVKDRVKRSGATDIRVKVETDTKRTNRGYSGGSEVSTWVEVRATATGQPAIFRATPRKFRKD